MTNESRNPLELEAVVRRFAESTEALANIRAQLQELTAIRDTGESANASLRETAGQVAHFAAETGRLLNGLEDAQGRLVEALNVSADLVYGTEFKEMAESVRANSQSISGIDNRVEALESIIVELLQTVSTLRTNTETGIDELSQALKSVHADVKEPKIVKRLF